MALQDYLGGINIFGTPIPTGILDPQQEEKLRNQALVSGIIGTAANYLATPKNLGAGSALPYLAKAYVGGMGASQNTVDTALNNAYRQQLLAARNQDRLYNVDGALVDETGKVVYQSPAKQQERKTKVVGDVLVDENTGEVVFQSTTQPKVNIGTVDPSKFTSESLDKFSTSGKFQDLKRIESPNEQLSFKDIYGGKPQLDVNGKPIFIPNLPGYPTLDANKRVVENVQLPQKADEKLSEGERTAGFLSERLNNSLQQLQAVTGQQPSAAAPNLKAEAIKFFTRSDYLKNLANPQSRQQVEAAQYDILDSALTLGTGAAYTREQLESYRRSYFPQLGDKPKTIEDKAARLQGLLDAAYKKAGRAAPKETQPSMTMPATQGWSIKKKSGG
jgi:hypothetical protein